jgi:hypothetical protein
MAVVLEADEVSPVRWRRCLSIPVAPVSGHSGGAGVWAVRWRQRLGMMVGPSRAGGAGTAPACYGRLARYGATELAKLYPLDASQLIDQVITPRIAG